MIFEGSKKKVTLYGHFHGELQRKFYDKVDVKGIELIDTTRIENYIHKLVYQIYGEEAPVLSEKVKSSSEVKATNGW